MKQRPSAVCVESGWKIRTKNLRYVGVFEADDGKTGGTLSWSSTPAHEADVIRRALASMEKAGM